MQIILSDNEIEILYNGLMLEEEWAKSKFNAYGAKDDKEHVKQVQELRTRLKPYIKDGQ